MRLLYSDIDTLRPDHLGCYGYHRATSTNIDALAADAIVFDNVHASDTPCLPSRTALLTGRFPDPVTITLPKGETPSFALAAASSTPAHTSWQRRSAASTRPPGNTHAPLV